MGLAFLIAFAAFLINGHQRRAPAAGAVQDAPEQRRAAARQGAAGDGRDRRRARRLGQVHLPDPGRGDHDRGRPLQRPRPALDHRLGDGRADARGRRLLVPAGGDQDRRQPDPDHQVRPAQPADAGPDAARPAAALRRRPLPDRADDLPQLVLPPARQRLRAALAADPDRRRRRRGLHRRALAQPDPAGDRRRRARHRRRLPLHAADRGRPGRLADRASSPTPATWCRGWCWRWRCCRSRGRCGRPTGAPGRRCSS